MGNCPHWQPTIALIIVQLLDLLTWLINSLFLSCLVTYLTGAGACYLRKTFAYSSMVTKHGLAACGEEWKGMIGRHHSLMNKAGDEQEVH